MEENKTTKKYTITKKIAKHGTQAIIVIPRILESELKPGTITQVTIEVLQTGGENEGNS
jgi:hypothetical protein